MKPSSKLLIVAAVLFLLFGVAYQLWTCATWSTTLGRDGAPPDIPCAGIPWTVFILGLWPVWAVLDVSHGHPVAGALFVLAFVAVIILFVRAVRSSSLDADKRRPVP